MFKRVWSKEIDKPVPSLYSAILRTFKKDIGKSIIFGAFYNFFFAASIVVMAALINSLVDINNEDSLATGYLLCGVYSAVMIAS